MSLKCSTCGATNADTALWCNQCFAPFLQGSPASDEASVATQAADVEGALASVMAARDETDGDKQSVFGETVTVDPGVDREPAGWACRSCESVNPIEVDNCTVCGASIYEAFGAEKRERPDITPRTALVWALIVPGMGHAKAGEGLLGLTLGALIIFSGLVAVAFTSTSQVIAATFFGFAHLGLWAISAVDAVSLANGNQPLLQGRRITIVAGALVLVIILQVISQIGGP